MTEIAPIGAREFLGRKLQPPLRHSDHVGAVAKPFRACRCAAAAQ